MELISLFILSFGTLSLAHSDHHDSHFTCPMNTSCFKQPANCHRDDCTYYLTVQENPTNSGQMIFDMQAKTDGWVAVGFSEDMLMGNDDVLMCDREARSVALIHSWNNDMHQNLPSRVTFGFYPHESGYTYVNGIVRCQFIRDKIIAPGNTNWFNMNSNQYHFLFALGPNGRPGESVKHTTSPCASTNKVDLSVSQPIEACPKSDNDDDDDDDASSTTASFLLVLIGSLLTLVFNN